MFDMVRPRHHVTLRRQGRGEDELVAESTCHRNGVIEVSLVRASRRDGASSKENNLNSNAAREAPPYGGAVQSRAWHAR